MKIWVKRCGIILATPLAVLALLFVSMLVSSSVKYRVAFFVISHFDVNDTVSKDELKLHGEQIRKMTLVDPHGETFDWSANPRAVILVSQWAGWCVPCVMELRELRALRDRVGANRLRVVLLSRPEFFREDVAKAQSMGIDFELVTTRDATPSQLAAVELGTLDGDDVVGDILPSNSFLRSTGEALAAYRSPRPWDSNEWEQRIRSWYDEGSRRP